MDPRMNITSTWLKYLTSTYSESGAKFNRRDPDFTIDLVCGVTITTLFLLTGCFFYVFYKIHASSVRGTLTDPNNVRFGRNLKEPIEMVVIPNNTSKKSPCRKVPANSTLSRSSYAKSSDTSRNDHSNICIAYKLQMRLENNETI